MRRRRREFTGAEQPPKGSLIWVEERLLALEQAVEELKVARPCRHEWSIAEIGRQQCVKCGLRQDIR